MQKYAKWLSLTGTLFHAFKTKKMKFLLLYFILNVSARYNTATKRETEVEQQFINNFDGELSEKVKIIKGHCHDLDMNGKFLEKVRFSSI